MFPSQNLSQFPGQVAFFCATSRAMYRAALVLSAAGFVPYGTEEKSCGKVTYKVVPPPVISGFLSPLTIDISPTKTIVIGLMFTNLANDLGHHPVAMENGFLHGPCLDDR